MPSLCGISASGRTSVLVNKCRRLPRLLSVVQCGDNTWMLSYYSESVSAERLSRRTEGRKPVIMSQCAGVEQYHCIAWKTVSRQLVPVLQGPRITGSQICKS